MGFAARRSLPAITGLLVAAATMGASAAPAAADFSWSGAGTANTFSTGANWGGTAPALGSSLGVLSFPDLSASGCDATPAPANEACYGTAGNGLTDDLGTLTAGELTIDAAAPYDIEPNDSTDTLALLGDGTSGTSTDVGLDASPTETTNNAAYIGVPLELGSSQQWIVDGGSASQAGTLGVDNVTGPTDSLDVNLPDQGLLDATTVDTGPLTIDGTGLLLVTPDASNNGSLPAAGTTIDDGPALDVASAGVTSGPINASAATTTGNGLVVGQNTAPEATLAVNGNVDLSPLTIFEFSVDGNDTTAGADSSQMTVNGSVSLNGAQLATSQGYLDQTSQACVALTPGNTYTLLSTSGGTISGTMHYWNGNDFTSVVDEGQTSAAPTPLVQGCTGGTAPQAYINYGSTAITATIAGAPASTGPPIIDGTAQVGQTLHATNLGSWSGYPAPSTAYQWLACAAGNCSPIIGATGSSFTLTAAQQGDTIELQVTATNALGHATADSSPLGPVTAAPAAPAPAGPTAAQIFAALRGIGHPSGKKAAASFIRTGFYRTSFRAPSAGALVVTWRAQVTVGKPSRWKQESVTVAQAKTSARRAGKLTVTIRITRAGRSLLRKKPSAVQLTAQQSFRVAGSPIWEGTPEKTFRL